MTTKVLERQNLARILADARTARQRIVLMNGVFDLLHVGHIRALQAAKNCGDLLVVAINEDEAVHELKGPDRPLQSHSERAEILAALACVDYVTTFPELDLAETLRALHPHVHAKGRDYVPEAIPAAERAVWEELEIELALVGDEKTHASSWLLEELERLRTRT